jgi:alpha-galactosidase
MVGDWYPNAKFPSGMAALAQRITDTGLVPGLWLAPFIALPGSDLARERPELLLRDDRGEPVVAGYNWGTGYWALDLAKPQAREHVATMIHRVVHEWGFRYLKIDFINGAAAPAARAGDVDRERVYRDGLTLIREVAGDDVYLLGSGAILLPSLGLLDGLRSGPDVAPMWQNYASDDPSDAMARNAVVNAVHRLWQAPLAEVDPDVVYFRRRLNLLTDQQLDWLRDLADICGFRAVSDPPRLAQPGRAQFHDHLSVAPPAGGPAVPVPLHHRRSRGRFRAGDQPSRARAVVSDLVGDARIRKDPSVIARGGYLPERSWIDRDDDERHRPEPVARTQLVECRARAAR